MAKVDEGMVRTCFLFDTHLLPPATTLRILSFSDPEVGTPPAETLKIVTLNLGRVRQT